MREITGKVAFIIRRTGCTRAYVREGRESKVTLRVLISAITGVAALGILPSDALAMSVKFSWKGYQACSTRSLWTVQALDGKGKALASTTIVERFPPQ
jgi:hypothetical protein